MEFAVSKSLLSEELGKLQSIVPKKSAISILSSIKVESDGQGLKLTATDMETTIYSHLVNKLLAVTEEGTMCLPAKRLYDIIKLMPDGPVKITSDKNDWVKIIAKGSSFRLPGEDSSKFPDLPKYDQVQWIDIPSKFMKGMLSGTRYAITSEDSRLNLRGAKLEIDNGEVRIITTDGNRISLASAKLDSLVLEDLGVLIPIEALGELVNLSSGGNESVGVGMESGNLFFKAGGRVLATRMMTGKFPSYQMPFQLLGTYEHFATFKADELTQSIKRALLSADEQKLAVTMTFEPGKLKMECQTAELGESNEVIDSNFNGSNLTICCNGKYLVEFLDPIGSGIVRVEIKDGLSQLYLIGERDGVSYYGCVMPMKA